MQEYSEKEIFQRTELLVGGDVLAAFRSAKVIIFGVGGVGSWCAEGLVRSGVRRLTIVDSDKVSPSNINRQLMATVSSVGEVKVEALKRRLLDINPNAEIEAVDKVYGEQTADEFDLSAYDYVIDAIDTLKNKARLILAAADLRKKLRQKGTVPERSFLCVYGDEVLGNRGACGGDSEASLSAEAAASGKAVINGTTAPVTAIFGMTLAGLVINDIYRRTLKKNEDDGR